MGIDVYPPFPAKQLNKQLAPDDYAFPARPNDYFTEIAEGLREGLSFPSAIGRTPDIDPPSAPEDLWPGGGLYTGFNAVANEELAAVSTSVNDAGTDVTSGTATGGSLNTLIDTGNDFVAAGVAVGDCLVNETQSAHGIITVVAVDTLTVYRMANEDFDTLQFSNEAGDDYRVVNASGTGAALIRVARILDEDYEIQPSIYITMNGTTTVTTSGVNCMRCTLSTVILTGSLGTNEGDITINQAVTTANIMSLMLATEGQSAIMAISVPAGKKYLIKNVVVTLTRQSGGLGSGTVAVVVRPIGQAFISARVYEVHTGGDIDHNFAGFTVAEKSDIKMQSNDVSDPNTVLQGSLSWIQGPET